MNPGELNCRVTLERPAKLPDDSGGYGERYTPYATVWAKISPKKARQKDFAEQTVLKAAYEITVHHHKGLKTCDRVRYKGRSFQQAVPAVNIAAKDAWLKMTAEEVVGDD